MRLYFATWLAERPQKDVLDKYDIKRRLLSFQRIRQSKPIVTLEEHTLPDLEIMLDSGAFSAWTRGIPIDIDDYAQFVLDNPGVFSIVANLDVIPGSKGRTPTQVEINKAAQAGWENWKYLEKKLPGTKILHAFHYGESDAWLKKIMGETDYLAIGGIAMGLTTLQRQAWLDDLMQRVLTDDDGRPVRKFHGFGVTSLDILKRYPWFSVDSTSWVLTGRFGGVYIPLGSADHKVVFSEQSPKQSEHGQHFSTYEPVHKRMIEEYLAEKGFTVEELTTNYIKRDELNVEFFLDIERNLQSDVFKKTGGRSGQPTWESLGLR